LTHDGSDTGRILRARMTTAAWSPLMRSTGEVLTSETQEFDVGGDDGTYGFPVTIEAENGMWGVLYNGLLTDRNTPATTFDAEIVLAATDAAGDEIVLTFDALQWLDLTYDTKKFFGAGIYPGVVATLISEA
jgi:hypothetical protein